MAQTIHGGSTLTESIGIKYGKIVIRYTQQKIGGGASGQTTGGWDLTTNRVAV